MVSDSSYVVCGIRCTYREVIFEIIIIAIT